MVVPNNLPDNWPLVGFLNNLGLVGITSMLIIALSVIRVLRDGKRDSIVHFGELLKKVNWTIVLLLGCVAPLSALLESDEAGIFAMITGWITPLAENMGSVAFMFMLSLILGVVTQFTHNMVLARLIIPLVVPVGMAVGIDPMLMMMTLALPIQFAVLTPGASANAALVWGNTGWTTTKSVGILALMSFMLMIIYNSVIVSPLAQLVF